MQNKLDDYLRLLLSASPLLLFSVGILIASKYLPPASLTAVEKVLISLASGLIALTGPLITGFLQDRREREKELRQIRRDRALPYRKFLGDLMTLCQRADWAKKSATSGLLDQERVVRVTDQERYAILKAMPPLGYLSSIDDEGCRKQVDEAIELGINYWLEASEAKSSSKALQAAYHAALKHLDYYENASLDIIN